MLLIEQPVRQRGSIRRGEHARADGAPDCVVHGVTRERRERQETERGRRVERPGGAQRAGREEQRITREKRRDDETGFREHDREEDPVHPRTVIANELEEMFVAVKDEVEH